MRDAHDPPQEEDVEQLASEWVDKVLAPAINAQVLLDSSYLLCTSRWLRYRDCAAGPSTCT